MTEQASLYDRLGGMEALWTISQTVVKRCMLDPTIGHIWDHLTEDVVQKEIEHFVDWMSDYWGGPVKYTGRDLTTVHRGMGITEEYWDALFAIIDQCYEDFDVAPDIRVEIDTFLRKFKPAIVGSPSFKDVVAQYPDMDVREGMRGVGVVWPPVPARASS